MAPPNTWIDRIVGTLQAQSNPYMYVRISHMYITYVYMNVYTYVYV